MWLKVIGLENSTQFSFGLDIEEADLFDPRVKVKRLMLIGQLQRAKSLCFEGSCFPGCCALT